MRLMQVYPFIPGTSNAWAAELDDQMSALKVDQTWQRSPGGYGLVFDGTIAGYNTTAIGYFTNRTYLTGPEYAFSFGLKVTRNAGGSDINGYIFTPMATDGTMPAGVGVRLVENDANTYYVVVGDRIASLATTAILLNYGQVYDVTLYWRDKSGDLYAVLYVNGVPGTAVTAGFTYTGKSYNRLAFGVSIGKGITGKPIARIADLHVQDNGAFSLLYPTPFVKTYLPDANGTYGEMLNEAGGAADFSKWNQLPNDADTTYNTSGTGAGVKRQTSLFADFNEFAIIKAVVTKAVAKVASGTTGATDVFRRDDGTDDYAGFTMTAAYTDGTFDIVDEIMPADGLPWTAARLNAFEAGTRRATGDRDFRCTGLYQVVSYLPSLGSADRRPDWRGVARGVGRGL